MNRAMSASIGLAMIVVGACGGESSVAPADQPEPSVASFDLPTFPPDSDEVCEPLSLLGPTSAVASATAVELAPDRFVSRADNVYVVLKVEGAKVLSRHEGRYGTPAGDDVDLSLTTVLVGPFANAGAEAEAVEELLDDPAPVLVVSYAEIATRQVRPRLLGAGHLGADGRIELLGPCGRRVQPSLDRAAEAFGTIANADWITRVADRESDEAVATQADFLGLGPADATKAFLDTPPADRDLTLTFVPKELRRGYLLVAFVLNMEASVRGGIGFATSAGRSSIVDTSQDAAAVNVMLLAPDVGTVEVVFFDPNLQRTSLGVFDAGLFDPSQGTVVTVTQAEDGSLSASVVVMADGELEERIGMTRDQLEAYREQLYNW